MRKGIVSAMTPQDPRSSAPPLGEEDTRRQQQHEASSHNNDDRENNNNDNDPPPPPPPPSAQAPRAEKEEEPQQEAGGGASSSSSRNRGSATVSQESTLESSSTPAGAVPQQAGAAAAAAMVPSKPVLRCQRKGKGKASEGGAGAGAGAVAKRSVGAGGDGMELVEKKGKGKRQRAGQSHKRGRQEEEDEVKPVVVPPALDKLWSVTCAAHFCPIKKSDEDFLRGKQLEILGNFGVAPGTMRKRAEEFEGTFLHPTMGPEDIGKVLDEEKSKELKLGLVPALGRPYEDLWAEESYVESLASRSWSSLARDSSQHAGASTSGASAAAAGAGTDTGADAAAAKAGGGGGSAEGERRSLRAGGRRSSGGGFGSFSGAAALLLHGSSPLAGGDGGADGADAVVGPCLPMARDWTEVVPSHDEASFRRCLAESRSRGGVFAGRRGFYLQRGGDIDWEAEEVEREKERRRAAAGLEAPLPPDLGNKGANGSSRSRSLPGTKSTTRTPSGSLVEIDEGVIVAKAFRSRGEKDRAAAAAAAAATAATAADINTKNAPQHSRPPRKAKRCAASRTEIGAGPGAAPAVAECPSRTGAGAPGYSPVVGCGGSSAAAGTPRAAWPAKDGNCAVTSGGDGGAVAVKKRTSVRLRGGAAAATAEPPPSAVAAADADAAFSGGQCHRQEEEGQEEDIDEVSWELRRLARDEVKVNAKNLYALSELGAYCRQERKVYQSVFDRDEWAKDVLSNALRLSEVGKTVDLKGKRAKPRGVGLADDFPYHDPTQLPVLEALRKQTVAYQHHQRNQEEMGGFGLAEIEQERARREKVANEATAVAEAKMKDWEHARLAVGRKGQTGRGRGIPIPGGVAHPFLLDKKTADFLYSVGTGDEVEVKDEWDVWCRAKVVAVRGEGGWDPKKDTNVLRAVKVSFEGSGPAMDAWCSVDGGMVAKPGTHLPLSKRQRALAARKASVAAAAAAAAASSRAGAKPIRIRAFHGPRPPPGKDSTAAVSSNGAANGSASADSEKVDVQGGAAAASAKRKRTGSSDDRRQGKRPAAAGEGFGGGAGCVDGETPAVPAAATAGMVPRCALRARAGSDSGNESSSSTSSDSSSSSGYNEVNATGRPRKTAASFRQARRASSSSGSSGSGGVGGSGVGGLDTMATRLRGTGDGGGSVKAAAAAGEAVSKEAGIARDSRVGRRGRGGAVVQQRKTARNAAHHNSSSHSSPSDPLSSRRTMPLGRGPSPPGDVVVPNGSVPAAVVAASPSPSSPSPFGRRSSGRVAGLSNGTGVGGGTAKDLRSVNSGGGGESGVNSSKGGASVSAAVAAAGLSAPAPDFSPSSTTATATPPTPPLSTATTSAAAAAAAVTSAGNDSPRTSGPWASAVTTTLTSWSATALGRISPTLTNRFVAAGTNPAAAPATAAAAASAAWLPDSNNGAVGGGHNAGQPRIGELANDAAVVGSNIVPPSGCDTLGGGVKANPHSGAVVAAANGQAAICSTLAPRDAAAVPTTAAAASAAAATVVGASPTPSGFAANVRASATNGLKVVFRRS